MNPDDTTWLRAQLQAAWGSTTIVINGTLIDVLECNRLIADGRAGYLAYRNLPEGGIEIVVIEALKPGEGVGRAMITDLLAHAAETDARFVSVMTTNDNLGALAFYQKMGFHLHALRPGAVDRARAELKPEIPHLGQGGLPIRDEIELRLTLRPDTPAAPPDGPSQLAAPAPDGTVPR